MTIAFSSAEQFARSFGVNPTFEAASDSNTIAGAAVIVESYQGGGGPTGATAVTYGGTSMTLHTTADGTTLDEESIVQLWFLGSSVPTDTTPEIAVTTTQNDSTIVTLIRFTSAGDDIEVQDAVTLINNSVSNPSASALAHGGEDCYVFVAGNANQNLVTQVAPRTGWGTDLAAEGDHGNTISVFYTYDTIGSTAVTPGWDTTTTDGAALIGVALNEVSSGAVNVSLGLASETDTALGMTADPGNLGVSIAQATETDSALGMAADPGNLDIALNLASETDSALTISTSAGLSVALNQASETDSALGMTADPGAITVPINQASEADMSQAFSVDAGGVVTLDLASETDLALSIAALPGEYQVAIGQASEVDTAQAFTVDLSDVVAMGLAIETDSALVLTPSTGPISLTLNLASETDSARPVTAVSILIDGLVFVVPARVRTIRVQQRNRDHLVAPRGKTMRVIQ